MVMLIFLLSTGSILFWETCFKKSKLFPKTEIWSLDKLEYVEFDGNFHFFFSFLDLKYSFWVNLVQKFNIVRPFGICKVQW